MKKMTFASLLLFSLLCSLTVFGQMKEWTWNKYKMKFKTPQDLEVKQNDSTKFEVRSHNMDITIYPRKGATVSESQTVRDLGKWARENNVENTSEAKAFDSAAVNGYSGMFTIGTKSNSVICLAILNDPDYKDIRTWVWISYTADSAGMENTLIDVLKSFTPI